MAKSIKSSTNKQKKSAKAPNPAAPSKKSEIQESLPLQAADSGPKATRKRVPKNFAEQYGGNAKAPARASAPAPKPRKSTQRRKAEQKLRAELMAPSDDLVARLARMGSVSGAVVSVTDDEAPDEPGAKKRGSRGWEHTCGKCGTTAKFSKAVGVCPGCGAIAVRES